MHPDDTPNPAGWHPEDLAALRAVDRGNQWLRAVLCTLARRGVAFRTEHPQRARALLDALAPLPLYKGGQFLFDLLEWEDFMVDGPAPPVVPTTLDAHALQRIAALLRAAQAHLDGAAGAPGSELDLSGLTAVALDDTNLPPLEPGFYLYNDVVLGAIRSAAPLLAAAAQAGQ